MLLVSLESSCFPFNDAWSSVDCCVHISILDLCALWMTCHKTVYFVLCLRPRGDSHTADVDTAPPAEPVYPSTGAPPQLSRDSHMTRTCDKATGSPEQIPPSDADGIVSGQVSNGVGHVESQTSTLCGPPQSRVEHRDIRNINNVVHGADVQNMRTSVAENIVPLRTAPVVPSTSGQTTRIELLPPTAFLFKSDGTPLVSTNGTSEAHASSNSLHVVSPPRLTAEKRECLPRPLSLHPVSATEGAGGDSLGGAASLDELRSRCQFSCAMDELVYIRMELRQCAEHREKLRFVFDSFAASKNVSMIK